MKSSVLRSFLEWALITSVLMSVGFFAWFWIQSHAMRVANGKIAAAQADIQNNHNVVGMLLAECQAYGRTNADMAKLLAPVAPTAPAPAAATKPGAR